MRKKIKNNFLYVYIFIYSACDILKFCNATRIIWAFGGPVKYQGWPGPQAPAVTRRLWFIGDDALSHSLRSTLCVLATVHLFARERP